MSACLLAYQFLVTTVAFSGLASTLLGPKPTTASAQAFWT